MNARNTTVELSTRKALDGLSDVSAVSQQGALVGRVIADLACRRRQVAASDGVAILRAVDTVLIGRGRRRSLTGARQAIALFTAAYLRRFWPPEGWQCVGPEIQITGGGRVDLVWRRPGPAADASLMFDELKTESIAPRLLLTGATATQIERYLSAGKDVYGNRFVGVRLISLRRPDDSLLIEPDGAVVPLVGSGLVAGVGR